MRLLRKIIIILLIFISISGYWLYSKYRNIYSPNVVLTDAVSEFIYIPTGSDFNGLLKQLVENNIIRNKVSFEWVADLKKLKYHIHPGKYRVRNGMSNNELVNLFRSGMQEPVKLTLFRIKTIEHLASKVSAKIEVDSAELVNALNNDELLEGFSLDKSTAICLFIPNTYEFFWNTSARQFINRMEKEYESFWKGNRLAQARKIGYSPAEIMALASIIEEETRMNDEKPGIAGVYMNRLKMGMKLDADPTVIYAVGDFTIRRVLDVHKSVDSPYNTYRHSGLPPGPICIPSVASIDAVLNYEDHDYLYFCAREDFSGYHNFAKTYRQHLVNARKFQKELNRRNIFN